MVGNPVGNVCLDVGMDAVVFLVMPNHVFVIVPLPDGATHSTACTITFALDTPRDRHFVRSNDCPNGTGFRSIGGKGDPLGRPYLADSR